MYINGLVGFNVTNNLQDGGGWMVPWWYIVLDVFVGAAFGIMLIALVSAGRDK